MARAERLLTIAACCSAGGFMRSTRTGRVLLATAAVLATAATLAASPKDRPATSSTSETGRACPLGLSKTSHPAPTGGVAYIVCTGRLASFDGTPLDTDLTLPTRSRGRLPLMVMLHGWGLSKTNFEASGLAGNGTNSWHWNNAWFAARGFA